MGMVATDTNGMLTVIDIIAIVTTIVTRGIVTASAISGVAVIGIKRVVMKTGNSAEAENSIEQLATVVVSKQLVTLIAIKRAVPVIGVREVVERGFKVATAALNMPVVTARIDIAVTKR